jgi:hypothetical protein
VYSREDRKRAVELWLKYDKCATAVTKELGYPCTKILKSWYKDFIKEQETGVIKDQRPYIQSGNHFRRYCQMLWMRIPDVPHFRQHLHQSARHLQT